MRADNAVLRADKALQLHVPQPRGCHASDDARTSQSIDG